MKVQSDSKIFCCRFPILPRCLLFFDFSYCTPSYAPCVLARFSFERFTPLYTYTNTYIRLIRHYILYLVWFFRLPRAGWPGNLNEGCVSLVCVQCKESFDSAWDLMVHAQTAHMMNVYQLATTRDRATASPAGTESENGSTVSVAAARDFQRARWTGWGPWVEGFDTTLERRNNTSRREYTWHERWVKGM